MPPPTPPTTSKTPQPHTRTLSATSTTSTARPPKTHIQINIYDLLPPGRLSTLLWTVGSSLLHTGVQILSREYAYGGHSKPHTTGVYHTPPRTIPPGATFRTTLMHGFTYLSQQEILDVVKEVSAEFLGTRYNLLTNNCNHFTGVLCERLTGGRAPAWLNRAAGIGLALPCVVPREWVAPPKCEMEEGEEEGELVDEDEDDDEDEDETVGMLERERRKGTRGTTRSSVGKRKEGSSLSGGSRLSSSEDMPPPRLIDTSGREVPAAERAPVPIKR